MSYQVYFTSYTEENQALIIGLLRLKEEASALEPNEASMLSQLRGDLTASYEPSEPRRSAPRRPYSRRRRTNGRPDSAEDF